MFLSIYTSFSFSLTRYNPSRCIAVIIIRASTQEEVSAAKYTYYPVQRHSPAAVAANEANITKRARIGRTVPLYKMMKQCSVLAQTKR